MKKSSETQRGRAGVASPASSENDVGDDPLTLAADLTAAATVHAADMEAAAAHAEKVLKVLTIEWIQLDRECETFLAKKEQETKSLAKTHDSSEQQQAAA